MSQQINEQPTVAPLGRQAVREKYEHRRADFIAESRRWERRSNRVSTWRLLCALGAILCGAAALTGDGSTAVVLFAVSFVLAVVLAVLIAVHRRVRVLLDRANLYAALNAEGAARIDRRWKRLPHAEPPVALTASPVAKDLDLFGRASLFRLASTANTMMGKATLAGWFLDPAEVKEIAARQSAVIELSGQLEATQQLNFLGREHGAPLGDPASFLDWAEDEPWLESRRWLWPTRYLVPMLFVLFVSLNAAGIVSAVYWLATAIVGLMVSVPYIGRMHATFARISRRQGEISRYVGMFDLLSRLEVESPRLQRLQATIADDDWPAHRHLDRLRRWMDAADLRFSQVYLPIQMITMWDFHILAAVERWQRRVGRRVRAWFTALGDFEGLCSLATLAHDHPNWTLPELTVSQSPLLQAEAIGHPLLPQSDCVANDVRVGPPGTFLLVTGSNMSGKSTLLRSIGTNVILAQAGSVVCARRMSLPPLDVQTSMRVQDSLEDGISFFMAELKRLKQVVDRAAELKDQSPRTLLYLLDEILQGTNSVERQIAVREVMTRLLASRAIGCISTHDLHVADVEPLASASRAVHFRETFESTEQGRRMTFDYRIHDGPATTTNALELLALVGLRPKTPDS